MKKLSIVLLAMVLVLACVFAACETTPTTYTVTLTTGEGYTLSGDKSVEEGKDYTFTLTIADGYEKSAEFAVKANGKVLAEKDGKYTVSAVTENITVTVTGVVKKAAPIVKHSVTLPTGEGYTVTGATEVVDGENYTFTLAATTGFNIDSAVVKVNGEELDNNGNEGEYTVENVTADLTITVEGLKIAKYTVTLTPTEGITYLSENDGKPATEAEHGSTYRFKATFDNAKYNGTLVVKNGDTELAADDNGVYSVENVSGNIVITVSGLAINTYTVTLTEGEGYTIAAADGSTSPVNYGGSFSFTVVVNSGYIAENLVVKANGTAIEAADGKYTVSNINSNITITVDGVEQDVFNERSLYKTSWYSGNAEAGDKKITVQPGTQIKSEWVQAALNAGYTHLRFDFIASGSDDGKVLVRNAKGAWNRYYRLPSAKTVTTIRIDLGSIVDDEGNVTGILFEKNVGTTSDYVLSNFALFKSTETTSWEKSSTAIYIANENGTYVFDTQNAGNDAYVKSTVEWWAKYGNNKTGLDVGQNTIILFGKYLVPGSNTRGMVWGNKGGAIDVVDVNVSTEYVTKYLTDRAYESTDKFYMALDKEGVYAVQFCEYVSSKNQAKFARNEDGSITLTIPDEGKFANVFTQDYIAAGYKKVTVTVGEYTQGQLWVGNDNWNVAGGMNGLNSGSSITLDLSMFDSEHPCLVFMASKATLENVTITVSFQ